MIENNNLKFRLMIDNKEDYQKVYKWCQEKFVYEWFEQRKLSYEEIVNKYSNKINKSNQTVLIMEYENIPIGLLQFNKYVDNLEVINKKNFKNIYEYDLFIGKEAYLSKGIGKTIINTIDNYLFKEKNADAIILRPFKRNIRAIKCYQKCGYQMISEYLGKNTIGDLEVICVMLKKF